MPMAISKQEKMGLGVAAALLLVGGGVWWWLSSSSAQAAPPPPLPPGPDPEPGPDPMPEPTPAPVDEPAPCKYGRKYLAVVAYNTYTPPDSFARVKVDENMKIVHPRVAGKFFDSAADAAEAGQQYAYQMEPPQPGEFVRVWTVQAAIGTAWTRCKFNYDLAATVKG